MQEEPEQVTKTVNVLQQRHEALRNSHLHLKDKIRNDVHHVLVVKGAESATVKAFADKSIATIAAWILSTTLNEMIGKCFWGSTGSKKYDQLCAAAIYAAFTAIAVPSCLWLLREHKEDSSSTIIGDQKTLLKLCLPMFFAWAWKDFVGAVFSLDEEFWPEVTVAVSLTLVIGISEALPCFQRSQAAIKAGGDRDTLLARIAVMPLNLGLAVGYAWNEIFAWAPNELKKLLNANLFIMMVQVVYYLIITSVITAVCLAWSRHHDSKAAAALQNTRTEKSEANSVHQDDDQQDGEQQQQQQHQQQQQQQQQGGGSSSSSSGDQQQQKRPWLNLSSDSDDVEAGLTPELAIQAVAQAERDLLELSGQVFIDSLGFIYAWAQLDTVNAFFFNYMMDCDSATLCSYQSNFALAAAVTLIFTRLAHMWKMEHRRTAWNRQATLLVSKSLSLNVGWAWSNYCSTAVQHATDASNVDRLLTYLMCAAFAWLVMSFVHRKFEVERRAWSRHVLHEVLTHGAVVD